MEKKPLNLHQKLVEIRKAVPYLQKDTESYKYKYVAGTDVLAPIVDKMNELNVLLATSVSNGKYEIVDNNYVVEADMLMTWIDADNPNDVLEVSWHLFGQQNDPSKAFGSGLTYSERYFLLKFFNIATDKDDPDAFQEKQDAKIKNGKVKENKDILQKIATLLQEHYPKRDGTDKTKKNQILDIAFGTHNWDKKISVLDTNILEMGYDVIKNEIKEDKTPISTDGPIDPPIDKYEFMKECKACKNTIMELNKDTEQPDADYYAITDGKKSNQIHDDEERKHILQVLKDRIKQLYEIEKETSEK